MNKKQKIYVNGKKVKPIRKFKLPLEKNWQALVKQKQAEKK